MLGLISYKLPWTVSELRSVFLHTCLSCASYPGRQRGFCRGVFFKEEPVVSLQTSWRPLLSWLTRSGASSRRSCHHQQPWPLLSPFSLGFTFTFTT